MDSEHRRLNNSPDVCECKIGLERMRRRLERALLHEQAQKAKAAPGASIGDDNYLESIHFLNIQELYSFIHPNKKVVRKCVCEEYLKARHYLQTGASTFRPPSVSTAAGASQQSRELPQPIGDLFPQLQAANSIRELSSIPTTVMAVECAQSTLSCFWAVVMRIRSTMRTRRTRRTERTKWTLSNSLKSLTLGNDTLEALELVTRTEQQGDSPSMRLMVALNCFIISGSYPHLITLSVRCHVGEQLP